VTCESCDHEYTWVLVSQSSSPGAVGNTDVGSFAMEAWKPHQATMFFFLKKKKTAPLAFARMGSLPKKLSCIITLGMWVFFLFFFFFFCKNLIYYLWSAIYPLKLGMCWNTECNFFFFFWFKKQNLIPLFIV
jgi:hypothetical protein